MMQCVLSFPHHSVDCGTLYAAECFTNYWCGQDDYHFWGICWGLLSWRWR